MGNRRKVIVIGVDGATFDLISPLVSEGKLPNFGKLMREGAWGELQSTNPPITPCAWTSFKTGVNPGKHGIVEFYYLDGNRELQVDFNRFRGYPSLWKILSDNGLRCCVYNVPFTYPPEKVNGILISGILTPSTRSNFTSPPDFREELLKAIPDYKIFPETRYSEREADVDAFYENLLQLIDVQFRTTRYLLEKEAWDFFMMVFNETDFVQHWFWKYVDPDHPDYTDDGHRKHGRKIYEIYLRIDEHIGQLLDFMDEETLFLIMSDHGAGPFIKRMYINNWLRKEGYLHLKNTPKVLLKRMCYRLGIHPQTLINIAFKSGLASMNQKVSFGKKKAIFSRIGFTFDDVDWNRTRAFSFGSYGPIYLNSVKNHPNGIVGEDEIPHLREEIMNKLREITDPERGIQLIDKIWQREELYHGPFAGELPDISYSMDNFSYTSSSVFAMPSYDIFSRPLTRKSGDHRLEGVLIAYGKGVASGTRIENANIVDVAPMILDFLNVEVPEEMDGKPLPEVFR